MAKTFSCTSIYTESLLDIYVIGGISQNVVDVKDTFEKILLACMNESYRKKLFLSTRLGSTIQDSGGIL